MSLYLHYSNNASSHLNTRSCIRQMVVGREAHCHHHTAHGYRNDTMKPDMHPGRLLGSLLLAGGLLASSQSGASGPQCSTLPPLPDGIISEAIESAKLCNIDFTSTSVAICPKTWSTSPAALIYDLRDTAWAGKSGDFEAQVPSRPQGTRRGRGRTRRIQALHEWT